MLSEIMLGLLRKHPLIILAGLLLIGNEAISLLVVLILAAAGVLKFLAEAAEGGAFK